MNGYNLEYIEKLRIHELRDYARKLGVSSPTTMKKEELIGKISSIIKANPFADKVANKGSQEEELDFFQMLLSDDSNVLEKLLHSNSENKASENNNSTEQDNASTIIMKRTNSYDYDTSYKADSLVGFSFRLAQNKADYDVVTRDTVYNVYGYVDIHPQGYGILRMDGYVPSSTDAYITSSIIKKHRLKKGHYIVARAKYIMENKPKVVFEVESIEYEPKVKNTVDYEELKNNGLGEEFYLEKFKLKCCRGERYYIKSMSLKDAVDLGFDLVDENGVNCKLINIKARPEEEYDSCQKMEVINVPFNKSEIEVVDTVQLVMERIKREMEMGQTSVLMIYNFGDLVRTINIACAKDGYFDFGKINVSALNKIYNILYLAKNVSEKVSCSVVCIDKDGVASDLKSLFDIELLPLFNHIESIINRVK